MSPNSWKRNKIENETLSRWIVHLWRMFIDKLLALWSDVKEFASDIREVFKKHGWVSNTTIIASSLFFAHIVFDIALFSFAVIGAATFL